MRKLLIGTAVFLLLGISGGVALAYLSGEDSVMNYMSAAQTEIEIEEEFDPPEEIEPGMEIRKSPRVKNMADSPCYVRMNYYFSDYDAAEFCEELKIMPGWTLGADGYYYWKDRLLPGESTDPLFEKVVIRKETEEQDLKYFEIYVYAEAVSGNEEQKEEWNKLSV